MRTHRTPGLRYYLLFHVHGGGLALAFFRCLKMKYSQRRSIFQSGSDLQISESTLHGILRASVRALLSQTE
jgi:hypothetical protein